MSCNQQNNCKMFLTAAEAKAGSLCNDVIFAEIQSIQSKILEAIKQCKMELTISGGTPLTSLNEITSIEITNAGSGYFPIEPTVSISHPLGSGANLIPVVTNGRITGFNIISGGNNYAPINAVADATTIGNGDAVFQVIVSNAGKISIVNVISGGTGYEVGDQITIIHPNGTGAIVTVAQVDGSGRVVSTVVSNPGQNYQTVNASISINHPNGFGFAGELLINTGSIVGVSITTSGYNYETLYPSVIVNSTTGSGAQFLVTVNNDGEIEAIEIQNAGYGYLGSDTVSILPALTSSGTGATATIEVASSVLDINPIQYYKVYKGLETNKAIQAQLDYIVNYFKCLGYNIQIKTNSSTNTTISWYISWY